MTIPAWIKTHTNKLISVVLGITVIVIAIKQGSDLLNSLKQVNLHWFIAGLGCYSLNYVLRALRIKIVMKNRIPLWPDAVHTACLHGLATYLLPFRSGEITLPVILNRASGLNFADGAKVLITVRFLDLCALGIWILTAAMLYDVKLPSSLHVAWVMIGALLLLLPLFVRWAIKLGKRLQTRFWQRLIQWGEGIAVLNIGAFFVSVGIWACVGACFFCTANAIHLPLGIMDVWLLITIQLPLQLIPIQGVANAGNHEGGWVAGLALLGIPTDQGLHFALLSHALLMTYVLALGPLAFLIRRSSKNGHLKKV